MLTNNLARLKENLELEKQRIQSRLNRTSIDSLNDERFGISKNTSYAQI